MKIRQAQVQDARSLFEAEEHWASIPGHLVSYPGELKESIFKQSIQDSLHSRTNRYLVTINELNVITAHACILGMPMKAHQHIGRVTVVIHKGFTNQGIGCKILSQLITWAETESDLQKLELLVRSTNLSAIHLYKSLGFVEEGRFQKRIKLLSGEFIDDVSMALQIC